MSPESATFLEEEVKENKHYCHLCGEEAEVEGFCGYLCDNIDCLRADYHEYYD